MTVVKFLIKDVIGSALNAYIGLVGGCNPIQPNISYGTVEVFIISKIFENALT